MSNFTVPTPPVSPVIIELEDKQRLTKWQEILKQLLPRITVILPTEVEMNTFRANSFTKLRKVKSICMEHSIVDWPEKDSVAFVVIIESSEPGTILCNYVIDDAYFFCFGDLAFGVKYFEWDGVLDEPDWVGTWSLEGFTKECLTWDFIYKRIVEKVMGYESMVPAPPAQG